MNESTLMMIKQYGHKFGYDFRNIVSIFMQPELCEMVELPLDGGSHLVHEIELLLHLNAQVPHYCIVSAMYDRDQERVLTTKMIQNAKVISEFERTIDLIDDEITLKKTSKRILVRQLYEILNAYFTAKSKWGVLVGVRPTKLGHELMDMGYNDEEIRQILKNDYYVAPDKVELLLEICHQERPFIYPIRDDYFSIYLSIPFCPTRCLYCSFPSYAVAGRAKDIERYTQVLIQEIEGSRHVMLNKKVNAIYFGGGTPATLSESQIERIVEALHANYDTSELKEFTFEAGRPDVIDEKLLDVLKRLNVDRVCVNPQTMDDRTLELIGRKHNVGQAVKAMALVKQKQFDATNMDLIVGLPEETLSDAKRSIESVLALKPTNITVHTLAIKKSSRLDRERDDYELPSEEIVEDMLRTIDKEVRAQGYVPYYMYRQKYMLGNLENVGYTLPGKASLYNMLIMEEKQTILAFGCGATSKCFFSSENRFERVHNVKSLEDYFNRVGEMIGKKNDALVPVRPSIALTHL